jgi:hypothetical protein
MIKKVSGTPEPEKNENVMNGNRLNNKMYQSIEIKGCDAKNKH